VTKISTIFFDVGGVCLTNGWDDISREKSAKKFSLDYDDMEKRHATLFQRFEKGKLTLGEYLNEVIFFKERKFTKKDFIDFMYTQSHAFNSTIKILDKISVKKKYELATINNESRELNDYRINKFRLDKYFRCFFSSCYLGVRKPEPEIFYTALNILKKSPGECLYIDDRKENYLAAMNAGLNCILLDKPANLISKLDEFKILI
jgi:putative hydrolase of the HAD superfamily